MEGRRLTTVLLQVVEVAEYMRSMKPPLGAHLGNEGRWLSSHPSRQPPSIVQLIEGAVIVARHIGAP